MGASVNNTGGSWKESERAGKAGKESWKGAFQVRELGCECGWSERGVLTRRKCASGVGKGHFQVW